MLNLYTVHDKISDNIICTFSCPNDGLAVRENYRALSNVAPIGDLDIVHIGTLNEKTLEVISIPSRVVPWDCYKFPESPIKPVATTQNVVTK